MYIEASRALGTYTYDDQIGPYFYKHIGVTAATVAVMLPAGEQVKLTNPNPSNSTCFDCYQ